MSEWQLESEANEADPVGHETASARLDVVYPVDGEPRVVAVDDFTMFCHGAYCGIEFDVDTRGEPVARPGSELPLTQDFGRRDWSKQRPANTIASFGVIYDAQRQYFLYYLYHLVAVDAAHYAVIRQEWMDDSEGPLDDPQTLTTFTR